MHRNVIVVAVCLIASSAARAADETNAPTTAPAADVAPSVPASSLPPLPAGLTPLFDGKTLEGWEQFPANSWQAKDGVIASIGVGRGVLYTTGQWERYRIIFDMRHVTGNKDHQACVLVFCTPPTEGEKPLDALGGIQFQVPNGGHWDYRKGHNNGGKDEFTAQDHPKFNVHDWSRVELLVDATTGKARMAVAQPPGSKAVEVLDFDVAEAGRKGPFALQMHNKGLFDEYTNIAIEENPTNFDFLTTKLP
jgi:hypothetical protein